MTATRPRMMILSRPPASKTRSWRRISTPSPDPLAARRVRLESRQLWEGGSWALVASFLTANSLRTGPALGVHLTEFGRTFGSTGHAKDALTGGAGQTLGCKGELCGIKSQKPPGARSVSDVQAPSEPLHLAVRLKPKLPGGGAADSPGDLSEFQSPCDVLIPCDGPCRLVDGSACFPA